MLSSFSPSVYSIHDGISNVFAHLVGNMYNSAHSTYTKPDSSKYLRSISLAAADNSNISKSACLICLVFGSCFALWLFLARFPQIKLLTEKFLVAENLQVA
jgi:hypothetical protein